MSVGLVPLLKVIKNKSEPMLKVSHIIFKAKKRIRQRSKLVRMLLKQCEPLLDDLKRLNEQPTKKRRWAKSYSGVEMQKVMSTVIADLNVIFFSI